MFDNRTYRTLHHKKGLVSFDVTVKQTNLNIQADSDLTAEAVKAVLDVRNIIEAYIAHHPEFAESFVPVAPKGPVPAIIDKMMTAGRLAGVGPMASIAGAVAQYTGQTLLTFTREVVIENGGDIFIQSDTDTVLGIHAGEASPFTGTCGISIKKRKTPYGVCTSSGTLGHSTSFGKADAAIVLSRSCMLADAAATSLCNLVQKESDIQNAIESGKKINGVEGIVMIKNDKIGAWGDITLVQT